MINLMKPVLIRSTINNNPKGNINDNEIIEKLTIAINKKK